MIAPLILGLHGIALRLACSIIAGAFVITHDKRSLLPTERRTNIFLSVAASTAMMIQVNLFLRTRAAPSAFAGMLNQADLPVCLLTGVGFIGGAMILRCKNPAQGLTRAATLWFIAVMGLCFGGGQLGLGALAFVFVELVLCSDRSKLRS